MATKFDYSEVQALEVNPGADAWEPPRHVYFGPKDPSTGKMAKEPVYRHQPFPALMYRKREDGVIGARQVNNESERSQAIAAGFADTPGVITAPSREQILAMEAEARAVAAAKAQAEAEEAALELATRPEKRGPGRPRAEVAA